MDDDANDDDISLAAHLLDMRRSGGMPAGENTPVICSWIHKLASVYQDYRYFKRTESLKEFWLTVEHPAVGEELTRRKQERNMVSNLSRREEEPRDISAGSQSFTAEEFLNFLGMDE